MGAGTARGGACLLISGNVRKNMEFVVFAGVLLLLFIFMICLLYTSDAADE